MSKAPPISHIFDALILCETLRKLDKGKSSNGVTHLEPDDDDDVPDDEVPDDFDGSSNYAGSLDLFGQKILYSPLKDFVTA